MGNNDPFNAEIQAAAGELWGSLIATDGDRDWALMLIAASAMKYQERFNEVASLALVLMASQGWRTALKMLAEKGVDAEAVRQRVVGDVFTDLLAEVVAAQQQSV
ncbi:hypothetical protein AB4Z09_26320 [Rhodococcus sp. TAF43]|uniref:hypothetical protein n=1 Tax=unclassified Rhodococcus (in: high G+C Gram-positive bacteria) TaxID=192944 RepID=UPI001581D261|nr:hypothetical protein [Rhodococcus sp. W8901]QKT10423.1 hypothetical protein HUN07_06560 [Rhodococcus sp. W8901]